MGLVAAAGKNPADITTMGVAFEELWRSGWDPKFRLADQERDGVAAEMIYPTVGMMLCNHPDFDFKKACFEAYNRWLQEYCAEAPGPPSRTCARSPCARIADGVAELKEAKAMGFRGVMMPGDPAVEDYDSPVYDPRLGDRGRARHAALLPHPDRQVRRLQGAGTRASTASCRSFAAARTSWARSSSAASSTASRS